MAAGFYESVQHIMDMNAFEEDARNEILSYFSNRDPDITQFSDTSIEKEKSDRNSELFDTLDFDDTTSDRDIAWSEICFKYKQSPCESCVAEGKSFLKKLHFIGFKEAIYRCENEECSDGDFELVRVKFWDQPLAENDIEESNVPGEIRKDIPVETKRDLKIMSDVVRYRNSLKRFMKSKEAFETLHNIEVNFLENRNAVPLYKEPPTKADFYLDKLSNDEVESTINILNLIEKATESKAKMSEKSEINEKTVIKNENDKVECESKKNDSLPELMMAACKLQPEKAVNSKVDNPKFRSRKKCTKKRSTKKRVQKVIFFDETTGKPMKEGAPLSGREMASSWNANYKFLNKTWRSQ